MKARENKIKIKKHKKTEITEHESALTICTNVECKLRKAGCKGFEEKKKGTGYFFW